MGNVQHQFDFQEIIKVMIESKKIKKEEDAIVANVIEFMKTKGLFPFKSIRAADMRNVKNTILELIVIRVSQKSI